VTNFVALLILPDPVICKDLEHLLLVLRTAHTRIQHLYNTRTTQTNQNRLVHGVPEKSKPKCFCLIFYKTWPILIKYGTKCSDSYHNVL